MRGRAVALAVLVHSTISPSPTHTFAAMGGMEDSVMSTSVITRFRNPPGAQHCFLNVCLQVLASLGDFRAALLSQCAGASDPLVAALVAVLSRYGIDEAVDVQRVRAALAALHKAQRRFCEFRTDDAAEALDALLTHVHRVSCRDAECVPRCPSHAVFGAGLCAQVDCEDCGATSDPYPYNNCSFALPVALEWLLGLKAGTPLEDALALHLRRDRSIITHMLTHSASGAVWNCGTPGCPRARQSVLTTMLQSPQVFVLNLSYDDYNPALSRDLRSLLLSLQQPLRLPHIFNCAAEETRTFHLSAIACHGSLHYIVFLRKDEMWLVPSGTRAGATWLLLDDALPVREFDWEGVVAYCIRNGFIPTLLCFQPLGMQPQMHWMPVSFAAGGAPHSHDASAAPVRMLLDAPAADVARVQGRVGGGGSVGDGGGVGGGGSGAGGGVGAGEFGGVGRGGVMGGSGAATTMATTAPPRVSAQSPTPSSELPPTSDFGSFRSSSSCESDEFVYVEHSDIPSSAAGASGSRLPRTAEPAPRSSAQAGRPGRSHRRADRTGQASTSAADRHAHARRHEHAHGYSVPAEPSALYDAASVPAPLQPPARAGVGHVYNTHDHAGQDLYGAFSTLPPDPLTGLASIGRRHASPAPSLLRPAWR